MMEDARRTFELMGGTDFEGHQKWLATQIVYGTGLLISEDGSKVKHERPN